MVMCVEGRRTRSRAKARNYARRRIHYQKRGQRQRLNYTEGYVVPISTGRPDVDAILLDWERRYSTYTTSSIFITTFNVNGRTPNLDGIPNWLTCEGIHPPDFYIIGLQEMDLSPQAFVMNTSTRHTEWKLVFAKSFPEDTDYDLIREVRLVGILLAIYRRVGSKIKIRASEVDVAMVPTGRQNALTATLGDKGGVAISLNMNDTTVCFVNAHFAAHSDGMRKRIRDYRSIIKGIRFRKSGRRIFDHDAVFWFGDLNFRLETSYGLGNDEFRILCADEQIFRDLIVYDQLKRAMKLKIIFEGFNEPEILNFYPTYKYDIDSDGWDSSPKNRVPAWCDRILWWNQEGVRIRQKFYESVQSIKISDHRPVRALFYMGVRKIDLVEYDRVYREAFKLANKRLYYNNMIMGE